MSWYVYSYLQIPQPSQWNCPFSSSSNLCCKFSWLLFPIFILQFTHRAEICRSEHRLTVSGLAGSTNTLSEVTHQTLHLLHSRPLHCVTLGLVVAEPTQSLSAPPDGNSEMTCSCKLCHSMEQWVCTSSGSGCSRARLVKPSLQLGLNKISGCLRSSDVSERIFL